MKFWLACFVLLFAGAELFQWVAQLGEFSGAWLVLGGMGLAAASNAKHLPMVGTQVGTNKAVPLEERAEERAEQVAQPQTASNESVTVHESVTIADSLQTQPSSSSPSATDTSSGPSRETNSSLSDQESISFKVRLPWF